MSGRDFKKFEIISNRKYLYNASILDNLSDTFLFLKNDRNNIKVVELPNMENWVISN
jgi:hypothetical protein